MPIISTIEAKCKDCYKCLRACPVKAIRFTGSANGADPSTGRALYAEVVKERCILDGECLRVCPQKAKKVRLDTGRVRDWIAAGQTVVASLAPSFAAAFGPEPLRVVAALRALGFAAVEPTAVGAELVAEAARAEVEAAAARAAETGGVTAGPIIVSACPVVVNLVEQVYPAALRYLSGVVSPMVAHSRLLKRSYPGCRVVFIGPCVAKKDEAERPEVSDAADAALTFQELADWLFEEQLDLDRPGRHGRTAAASGQSLEAAQFDGYRPLVAPLFPVEGGLLRTATLPTDLVSGQWLAVSGMENCREMIESLAAGALPADLAEVRMVEMLACRGGCVAGPAMPDDGVSPAVRRQRLLRYVAQWQAEFGSGSEVPPHLPSHDLRREYRDRRPVETSPSERQISDILARMGKAGPEDELNCGVCGYASCREKAVAVHQGMAELDMCLPYMREMAESISNLVLAASPYGVAVVDRELGLVDANAAFRTMFGLEQEARLTGRRLAGILDDALFRRVLADRVPVETEVAYPERGLLTRQTIFHLGKRDAVVGIFMDLSEVAAQREQFERLRDETVQRAREVISKQMNVAQEIAGLLGETTAETKVILTKLIEFINQDRG